MSHKIKELFTGHPLLPVVEIMEAASGPPLAQALLDGGIKIIEITLRTDAALSAAELIGQREDIIVGIGTILEADQFRYAHQVEAQFAASPGFNMDLLDVAKEEKMPYLPGVFTASEIMLARDLEYEFIKFFPTYTPTGLSPYPQLAPAFPKMQFCLTGGISQDNFDRTLAMQGVIAVGGSWLAPRQLIEAKDFKEITARAKFATDKLKANNIVNTNS